MCYALCKSLYFLLKSRDWLKSGMLWNWKSDDHRNARQYINANFDENLNSKLVLLLLLSYSLLSLSRLRFHNNVAEPIVNRVGIGRFLLFGSLDQFIEIGKTRVFHRYERKNNREDNTQCQNGGLGGINCANCTSVFNVVTLVAPLMQTDEKRANGVFRTPESCQDIRI